MAVTYITLSAEPPRGAHSGTASARPGAAHPEQVNKSHTSASCTFSDILSCNPYQPYISTFPRTSDRRAL